MNPREARREELRRCCREQRNEIIAASAARTATLPGARWITRWLRIVRRLLRGVHRETIT